MKILGSLLIMIGCSACGFYCAFSYKSEVALLRSLSLCLEHISAQLEHKLLPLPVLLIEAASITEGKVSSILNQLSSELDNQSCPDVHSCMSVVLQRHSEVSSVFRESLINLSHSLGKFDLSGQMQGLKYTHEFVREKIGLLESDLSAKTRIYKTLGLCAGLGMAIILL